MRPQLNLFSDKEICNNYLQQKQLPTAIFPTNNFETYYQQVHMEQSTQVGGNKLLL